MKNNKLVAAVIGMGEGFRHIKAFKENTTNYSLEALCDIDTARCENRLKEYQLDPSTKIYSDFKELAADPEIDVVSVTSPDYFHAEQSIAMLEAGKHVLCEKPMTLDLDEAAAIAECVRKTGKVFMIAHPTRYTPAFILAKKMIARGDIGELFMAETEYAHNYRHVGGANNWRKDKRRDPMLGGGCHAVDFLRWAVDDLVDEAFAYGTKKGLADWPIDFDSYFSVYKFKNGVIGKVMCSIGLSRPYTMRSVFYGTKGTIICDNRSPSITLYRHAVTDNGGHLYPANQVAVDINHHNVGAEIRDMALAIINDTELECTVYEGANTVAVGLAAVESAAKGGEPVAPAYVK